MLPDTIICSTWRTKRALPCKKNQSGDCARLSPYFLSSLLLGAPEPRQRHEVDLNRFEPHKPVLSSGAINCLQLVLSPVGAAKIQKMDLVESFRARTVGGDWSATQKRMEACSCAKLVGRRDVSLFLLAGSDGHLSPQPHSSLGASQQAHAWGNQRGLETG